LFTTEQAMAECLPYYTELFDQMKAAAADPQPVAVVAPAVAE
jgi:3beta-hydroxy-delta5-steroid dehydrogenase/steroid delta-isomerase